jgi:hypothetical protein
MVSLERVEYLKKIEENWKTKLFHDFIVEKSLDLSFTNSDSTIDKNFISFIKSVTKNKKSEFIDIYSEFSKRKPSDNSPWIYDNYLIFIIIIGVVKFEIDKSWILNVVGSRQGTNNELKEINTSLINILKENYTSKDNLFELIFLFQELINLPLSPVDELNQLYERLVSNSNLLSIRDDFLKLIRLRAIDIIILKKELPDTKEISDLKSFKSTFTFRVKTISKIINVLIVLGLILGIIYFRAKSKENQDFVDLVCLLLGVLGVGLIAFIKWISKQISIILLWFFGYTRFFNDYKNKK